MTINNKDHLKKHEQGFFIADLMMATIGFTVLMAGWMLMKAEDAKNSRYAATGNYIAQLSTAVREYSSNNSATIVANPNVTYTGVAFLKSNTCGGTIVPPATPYLPCSFNGADPLSRVPVTTFGNTLAVTGAGSALTAMGRTIYPPIIESGKLRMDIAEKIIRHAEGASYTSSSGAAQNTYINITLDRTATVGNRGRIFVDTTVNSPAQELYIRRDGTNSPIANINWANKNLTNVNTVRAVSVNTGSLTATGVVKGADVRTNAGRTLRTTAIVENVVPMIIYRPAGQPTQWFSYADVSTAGIVCDTGLSLKIFASVVAKGNTAVSNGWVTYAIVTATGFQIRARNHTTKWDASDVPSYVQYRLRCM